MSQPQHPEHNWWTLVAVCGATFMLLLVGTGIVAAGAVAAFALIRNA